MKAVFLGRAFLSVWVFISIIGIAEANNSPPLFYRFFKYRYFDVDEILRNKLAIKFSSCEYLSQVESKMSVYDGIGPCLYLMFIESLGTANRAGVVRAKAHLLGEKSETSVHVFANPTTANDSLIYNVFRLVQERLNPERIRDFQDAFWGTWVIDFPNADGLSLISNSGLRSLLQSQSQPLKAASISFFPVREKRDSAFHQGMVYFFSPNSTVRGDHVSNALYELYFKTDLLTKKDHRFLVVEGQ